MRRRGFGIHVGGRTATSGDTDVVCVQHHVGPQRFDPLTEGARRSARRRSRPRIVVKEVEECGERRTEFRQLVGDHVWSMTGALIHLALGGLRGTHPVEPARHHVRELTNHVLGHITG